MSIVVYYFQLSTLQYIHPSLCIIGKTEITLSYSLFLNICSTKKLCLLTDVMLVSLIILRIMIDPKKKTCYHMFSLM